MGGGGRGKSLSSNSPPPPPAIPSTTLKFGNWKWWWGKEGVVYVCVMAYYGVDTAHVLISYSLYSETDPVCSSRWWCLACGGAGGAVNSERYTCICVCAGLGRVRGQYWLSAAPAARYKSRTHSRDIRAAARNERSGRAGTLAPDARAGSCRCRGGEAVCGCQPQCGDELGNDAWSARRR